MSRAYLFTQPNPRMGPAETDLYEVKAVSNVALAHRGKVQHFLKNGALMAWIPGDEILGVAVREGETKVFLGRTEGKPIDLAKVAHTVAVIINDQFFWLREGHWVKDDDIRDLASAWSVLRASCVHADGYKLTVRH